MKVKSIKQLREKILEQAKKGLEESKDEIKDIVHEESVRIYDEFESHAQFPYERRFDNNGFADEDNIKASGIKEKGNRVSYTVENTTMANGDDFGERLDYYIEEGKYEWDAPELPDPRPFMENAKEEIEFNETLQKYVKKSLKEIGKVK